jgi:hypothetical protein
MAPIRSKSDLIGYALEHASSDPDKAEDVLQFFCEAIERGDVPDREILEYLATCFCQILSGETASDALSLTRTKGKRRRRTLERQDERHFDLALAVARCMKEGIARDDAFEHVSAQCGAGISTVRRAYDEFRQIARELA